MNRYVKPTPPPDRMHDPALDPLEPYLRLVGTAMLATMVIGAFLRFAGALVK